MDLIFSTMENNNEINKSMFPLKNILKYICLYLSLLLGYNFFLKLLYVF
jgi:hypothetical protein